MTARFSINISTEVQFQIVFAQRRIPSRIYPVSDDLLLLSSREKRALQTQKLCSIVVKAHLFMSQFSDACYYATGKTLQVLFDAVYTSCVVTVRTLSCCRRRTCPTVAALVASRSRAGVNSFASDVPLSPVRFGRGADVLPVVAHEPFRTKSHVAAVWLDDLAHMLRQLLRCFDVGRLDGLPCE